MWELTSVAGHADQRYNSANQHHKGTLRAGNDSVLPKRVGSEYTVYVSSGSSNRREREILYSVKLTYVLPSLLQQ
jgi:hypothetical protein